MTTDPAPLFSIITVTRNHLNGLKRTMESIAAQSLKDYEWIVIDGNSTDGTKDFLPAFCAQWISEPDDGIYDAMNKGIDRACGQYLIFMNAGDLFADADILATLSRAIEAENPDFIYGDALENIRSYKKARDHGRIADGMFTHHQAMIYRRGLADGLNYDISYKIAADYDFTARFLRTCESAHYIPCAICVFESGGISQTSQRLGRQEQSAIRHRLELCPAWQNLLISLRQSAANSLKNRAPGLYSRIRHTNV